MYDCVWSSPVPHPKLSKATTPEGVRFPTVRPHLTPLESGCLCALSASPLIWKRDVAFGVSLARCLAFDWKDEDSVLDPVLHPLEDDTSQLQIDEEVRQLINGFGGGRNNWTRQRFLYLRPDLLAYAGSPTTNWANSFICFADDELTQRFQEPGRYTKTLLQTVGCCDRLIPCTGWEAAKSLLEGATMDGRVSLLQQILEINPAFTPHRAAILNSLFNPSAEPYKPSMYPKCLPYLIGLHRKHIDGLEHPLHIADSVLSAMFCGLARSIALARSNALKNKTVQGLWGRSWTALDLVVEAVELLPSSDASWIDLSIVMPRRSRVIVNVALIEGSPREVSRVDCAIMALRCREDASNMNALAYYMFIEGETPTLESKWSSMTPLQAALLAASMNPDDENIRDTLALILGPDRTVDDSLLKDCSLLTTVPASLRGLNAVELYMKALEGPYFNAFHALFHIGFYLAAINSRHGAPPSCRDYAVLHVSRSPGARSALLQLLRDIAEEENGETAPNLRLRRLIDDDSCASTYPTGLAELDCYQLGLLCDEEAAIQEIVCGEIDLPYARRALSAMKPLLSANSLQLIERKGVILDI